MRYSILSPLTTVVLTTGTYAQNVEFFYTETVDLCEYNNNSIQANEQTTHGGVCAYRPDVERVYGCPAPDTTCWTWGQDCSESTVGQTVCNKAGAVWCCNAVADETCTTAEGYINICQSGFSNPESGVSIDKANQVYLSAIGLSNITATSQSVDPTPFSTRNLGTSSTTSASTSSTSSTDSTSATGSSTSSTASTTSTSSGPVVTGSSESSSNAATSSTSGSSLSGGAIAGIVVGALVVLALICGAFFLGRRRSRAQKAHATDVAPVAAPPMTEYYGPNDSKSKLQGSQYESSELGDSSRVEMPATNPAPPNPNFRPHELP